MINTTEVIGITRLLPVLVPPNRQWRRLWSGERLGDKPFQGNETPRIRDCVSQASLCLAKK